MIINMANTSEADRAEVKVFQLGKNESKGLETGLVQIPQQYSLRFEPGRNAVSHDILLADSMSYPYNLNTNMPGTEIPNDALGDLGISEVTAGSCDGSNRDSSTYIARPPPQVMTALGPIPLPEEIRQKIPEKFVAKPIIEEREIYVAKKEVQERTIEIPHVQYEHRFTEVPRSITVDKLIPVIKEVIKEIPREIYKPVIEEKVIEVPQGVKYVEVPVEIPCMYPPKVVSKPITQLVERVVETIKPVVKEQVIEVPQTIVKQVPKIKTVEIPYYVPRYKEKIIEVPYRPPASGDLPLMYTSDGPINLTKLPGLPSVLPMQNGIYPVGYKNGTPFSLGPIPLGNASEINLPYDAKIEVKVVHPTNASIIENSNADYPEDKADSGNAFPPSLHEFCARSQVPIKDYENPVGIFDRVKLPEGFHWGPPRSYTLNSNSCLHFPYMKPSIPPMMVTCPPEVGKVSFSSFLCKPDILTRAGILPYDTFRANGNPELLFPPLHLNPLVPMAPPPAQPGTPDIRSIDNANKSMSFVIPECGKSLLLNAHT